MEDTDDVSLLYKQNLAEWIYDDNKLITYQYLSISLGVHANLAKQMLYEFYKEELQKQELMFNKADKRIQALYYVSGLTAQPDSEVVTYCKTICREDKLESVKEKLKTLTSVHLYALEAIETDVEQLRECVMNKLHESKKEISLIADLEEQCHVKWGPFKGIKPSERNSRVVVRNNDVEDVKPKPKTIEKKEVQGKKSSTSNKEKPKISDHKDVKLFQGNMSNGKADVVESSDQKNKNDEKPPLKRSNTKSASTNEKSNRLKNMFAAAASKPAKPKPKKEEVETPKSKAQNKSRSSNGKTKEIKIKRESEGSRKRKRIKDILSSDEEEEESENEQKNTKKGLISSAEDEDEEDFKKTPNEIHRQRIRMLIDSESEEERDKTPSPKKPTTTPPVQPAKKMRKSKVVTTQVMDEEGYLVTKKEKIFTSDSDGDEESTPPTLKTPEDESSSSKQPVKSHSEEKKRFFSTSPSSPPTVTKKSRSTPSSKRNLGGPKTKQGTLTSFFIKKT